MFMKNLKSSLNLSPSFVPGLFFVPQSAQTPTIIYQP